MPDLKEVVGTPTKGGQTSNVEGEIMSSQEALLLPSHCKFTRTSLIISESTTEAEWKAIGETLRTMQGAVQFWIGDWLRFGEGKKYIGSDKYDEAEEQTGLKRGTLKVYASVAKNVPSLMRINQLSFQHHQLVAHCSEKKQKQWLEKAVDEAMTVRKLRAAMSSSKSRVAKTHDETLAELKKKFQRLIKPFNEWPELEGLRAAIDEIKTEIQSN